MNQTQTAPWLMNLNTANVRGGMTRRAPAVAAESCAAICCSDGAAVVVVKRSLMVGFTVDVLGSDDADTAAASRLDDGGTVFPASSLAAVVDGCARLMLGAAVTAGGAVGRAASAIHVSRTVSSRTM